ncbi:MAG: pro-sigmaK processing inhibitor BofA family protein [Ruminococcus sp.]|nr:pro-sigmaK processing inhibitor BofA family protein [Ruminococcus sp.]
MSVWMFCSILAATFAAFAFCHFLSKNKHPFKRALLSMGAGAGTLCAVNLLSGITGVAVPLSVLSVLTAVVGGVPGVTLLLFLNLLIK